MRISTPEGVELELTLAGLGSRFTARLIDHALQILLIGAAIALLIGIGDITSSDGQVQADDDGDNAALGFAIFTIFSFLVTFTYDLLFEVRGGGRTPGKRLTGLRVVRVGGRPVGFISSAIRNVVRIVDLLPGFYAIGMAAVFASKNNPRLGDIAAGTIVVRERTGGRGPRRRQRRLAEKAAAAAGGGPALDASGWDVSAITGEEIATVRRFLDRRPTLTDAARAQLAGEFAGRLRPKVAGAPDGADPEAFLEALSAAKAARSA